MLAAIGLRKWEKSTARKSREEGIAAATQQLVMARRRGDYPWYNQPIPTTKWNADGTVAVPHKRSPRMYHLVVDLVYSALFGAIALWLESPEKTTSETNCVGQFECAVTAYLFILTFLNHWWRLNLFFLHI